MLIWYILCMSGTWKTDLCPSPRSNGEKWWYDVPRILTKFMNVNVIHKNAKIWCQIHSYIKDQKRQTVILTLFIYAKIVILSFLYLEILMVRNEYDTDCRSKKNDTDPLEFWNIVSWYFMELSKQQRGFPWTQNAYSLHFRGTGSVLLLAQNLYLLLANN